MKAYEGYFILPPEAALDARKQQLKMMDDTIKKFNGKVLQKTEIGKRFLGYSIRKHREGYAVVVDFELEPRQQDGFRRAMELQEDIVKFMITVKTAVPQAEKAEAPKTTPRPAAAPIKKNLQEHNATS